MGHMKGRLGMKARGALGPDECDDKEITMLNRIVRDIEEGYA